ncbi:hypothetical protein KDV42_02860, partial [Citrobacter freundii]|uniref:hypothetical protein n=1 Tax=Citrobacter freundii TaxID=546 RepID=UPI00333C9EC0
FNALPLFSSQKLTLVIKNIATKIIFGYSSFHQRRTNHAAVVQKNVPPPGVKRMRESALTTKQWGE